MIKAAIAEKKERGYVTLTEEQKRICEDLSGYKFEKMWIGKTVNAEEV